MKSKEIREKFLNFFGSRGHAIVPSSSLIPEDPSVLLTTAGMQQFKPYFTSPADAVKDFGLKNTVSIQKSFRTSDIDEVGDESHLTFFEMLGNFSFGGYFKDSAIKYAYEFIVGVLGLHIDYVSVFEGDENVPEDKESTDIWKKLGVKNIKKFGKEDNFWGPTGVEGPCGPTTEIYVDGVEIWNIVFNEYYCNADKSLTSLKTPGVDTGMGLERLAMVLKNKQNIFDTDLFTPTLDKMTDGIDERERRIIVDHVRAIVFLVSDGVRPSNKEAGYILRRLMRRVIIFGVNIPELLSVVADGYKEFYPEINIGVVLSVYDDEQKQFSEVLKRGVQKLEKLPSVDTKQAFNLYQTYGLPYEVIKDFDNGARAKDLSREDFEKELDRHRDISRAGSGQKFKGGLADDSPETIRLHTAHHLLLASLQRALGPHVKQRGSNITSERLRLDFSHSGKMSEEEVKEVENMVNEKIKEGLDVTCKEMPKEEALNIGAEMEFGANYGDIVSVYIIKDKDGNVISSEFCGGPHVSNTSEIGKFKIIKEEAVSAGVRRIRAKVNPALENLSDNS